MEVIVSSYEALHAAAGHAIQASNKGHDAQQVALASALVEQWRTIVLSRVDAVTRAGFNTVPRQSMAPLAWPMDKAHVYSDYLRMERQMHFLVQREQAGKVTININGSHNNVAAGSHNKQGGVAG